MLLEILADYFGRRSIEKRLAFYHQLARIASKLDRDHHNREVIVIFLIGGAIQSDTISSLKRLISGSNDSKDKELIAKWSSLLEQLLSNANSWVSARIRIQLPTLNSS